MSEEADALAEAARNRGLKLVRSRVRSPEKRGFGKLGLTDAKGEPVFGLENGKPAATPEDVAEYLRGAEVSDWKASLKQVGGKKPNKGDRHPELVSGSIRPPTPKSDGWMLKQVQHDERNRAEAQAQIREAKPADSEQLASLFALLGHDVDAKAVARNVKSLAKLDEPVIVVARGKDLLGACGVHRMIAPHRDRPVGRITILVVTDDARKQGLGRMLVEEAERRLAKLGCGLIEVTSNDRLREAHAFYRHMGYERTSMRFAKVLPSG